MSGIKKADLQKIRLIRTCSFSQKIIFVKQQKKKMFMATLHQI